MSMFLRTCAAATVAAACLLAAGVADAGGHFEPVGTMVIPRTHQGSAVLPDGKVLQVGGLADAAVIAVGAELYDPATGEFTMTGSMFNGRMRPTTIGLADGRVLVAGGRGGPDNSTYLTEAEVYDPATGTFAVTGSMGAARYVTSVALLQDGRVLMAGGSNRTDGTLGSAELYDPDTGTFSPTGDMVVPRDTGGRAVTLLDGRVLIVGGYNDDGALASAEVYDPATGTFALTGPLASPRGDYDMTLLADGRVLVVGGLGDTAYLPQAEIWDPATGTFSPSGTLVRQRANPDATLLADGRVLITGGSASGGPGDPNVAMAEIWDPATGTFSEVAELITPRSLGRTERLGDGSVLIMGGWATQESLPTDAAERFVPALAEVIFANGFDLGTR